MRRVQCLKRRDRIVCPGPSAAMYTAAAAFKSMTTRMLRVLPVLAVYIGVRLQRD